MYLSHIDDDKYTTTAKNIKTTLELISSSIPIKYRVPGLATIVTQLIVSQSINEACINMTKSNTSDNEHDNGTDLTDDKYEAV